MSKKKRKKTYWTKDDYVKAAHEAGIPNPERMKVEELRLTLKEMRENGEIPDKRGGAQEGAGRPQLLGKSEKVREMKEQHLFEEVEVLVTNRETGKIIRKKKQSLFAVLDMLRTKALKEKDVPAAKEYLDRTLGKALQEIEFNDISKHEQKLPTEAEKAAARAYIAAIKDHG